MLLPVFAILGTSLYVIFNQNAKDSYFGETINEETLVNINNVDDMVINKKYRFNLQNINNVTLSAYASNRLYIRVDNILINNTNALIENTTSLGFYVSSDGALYYYFYDDNNNQLYSGSNISLSFEFTYYSNNVLAKTIPSLGNIIQYSNYNKFSYLSESFYYSIDEINNNGFFSWAKTSFLGEPITYISGLFGVQSDSAINTLLSYWLAISIIWLCFDLVMYLPLLVHRWIDKGMLE